MAVTNGWGQGVENNTIEWGKGKDNATNDWGKIYETSASGDTLLEVATVPFSNTKSLDFDGVDDYVDVGVLSSIESQTWSISLWVKWNTLDGTNEAIISTRQNSLGSATGIDLNITDAGAKLRARTYKATSGGIGAELIVTLSSVGITTGVWYHIAVTYSSSTLSMKINDGAIYSGTDTGTYVASGVSAYIGNWRKSNAHHNGLIDEVAIFNTELSASDITAIYNSGTPQSLASYNPTSWWRMGDGDTFPTLTDNGSAGNNGTMTNMVAGDIVADVPPTFNKYSMSFDGVDDHITMGNVLDFNKSNSFSFSCWIKRASTGTEEAILSKINHTSTFKGYEISFISNNTFRLLLINSGSSTQLIRRHSSSAITDTNWHHIVATYDGSANTSGINLYLDGNLNNGTVTGTISGDIDNSFPFCIGSRNELGAFFDGKIDEVAIFNAELSASDVTDIYNSGEPTDLSSYSNLVSWWRFEEGSGTTATDSGSGGNNGTITNGATYSTDKP